MCQHRMYDAGLHGDRLFISVIFLPNPDEKYQEAQKENRSSNDFVAFVIELFTPLGNLSAESAHIARGSNPHSRTQPIKAFAAADQDVNALGPFGTCFGMTAERVLQLLFLTR